MQFAVLSLAENKVDRISDDEVNEEGIGHGKTRDNGIND
jgi:hypothetical protein